jgi:hypothetical protein
MQDFTGGLCWEGKPKSADTWKSAVKVSERNPFAPTWNWQSLLGRQNLNTPFALKRVKHLGSCVRLSGSNGAFNHWGKIPWANSNIAIGGFEDGVQCIQPPRRCLSPPLPNLA